MNPGRLVALSVILRNVDAREAGEHRSPAHNHKDREAGVGIISGEIRQPVIEGRR